MGFLGILRRTGGETGGGVFSSSGRRTTGRRHNVAIWYSAAYWLPSTFIDATFSAVWLLLFILFIQRHFWTPFCPAYVPDSIISCTVLNADCHHSPFKAIIAHFSLIFQDSFKILLISLRGISVNFSPILGNWSFWNVLRIFWGYTLKII